MKARIIFIAIALLCFSSTSFSKHVSLSDAKEYAKNFYFNRANQLSNYLSEDKVTTNGYYIFNVNKENGFVIIASEDVVSPILGYSFENRYEENNLPPALKHLLNNYSQQISFAKENKISATDEIQDQWNKLKFASIDKSSKSIEPLLLTNWNQTGFYNELCPEDSEASNGRVPVGCVAIAMAQVMKYYNYPETGTNSYSYTPGGWWGDGVYGTLSANFANTTYKWNEMPYNLNRSCEPLAKFLLHCGIAVSMNYGPDGSGSQTEYTADALEQYFRYSNDVEALSKDNYSEANWNNILQNELDNNRVIIYAGSSETVGHAWNIDGYQGDNHYHMNWGWGGSYNGYFYLNDLVINATADGEPMVLEYNHTAVVNIYPENSFPLFCSDDNEITGQFGNIEDGSANLNYNDNQSCSYSFQPDCGAFTKLSFERFNIDPDDYIAIYDGTSTEDELIDIIYGDETPDDITSNGNGLFLNFVTNSSNNSTGWAINYDTEFCKSTDTIVEFSGSLSDGSGDCEYESTTYCRWVLSPEGAQSINLNFTEFEFAEGNDNLKIYKESFSGANMLYEFSSSNPPTTEFTVPSGKILIKFFTGTNDNSDGWAFDYVSSTSSIESIDDNLNVKVFPNPFTDKIVIDYTLQNRSDIGITITDVIGKELYKTEFSENTGSYSKEISDIEYINKGIYILKIEIDGQSYTKKIICNK